MMMMMMMMMIINNNNINNNNNNNNTGKKKHSNQLLGKHSGFLSGRGCYGEVLSWIAPTDSIKKKSSVILPELTWRPRNRYCPSSSETVSSWKDSQLSSPMAWSIQENKTQKNAFKKKQQNKTKSLVFTDKIVKTSTNLDSYAFFRLAV